MAVHRRTSSLRHQRLVRGVAVAALALVTGCASHPRPDNATVCRVYAGQSSQPVVAQGTVTQLAREDGSRAAHPGFMLQLTGDCDLLVHVDPDVELTGSMPLHPGDTVVVSGTYEFGALGGAIHRN